MEKETAGKPVYALGDRFATACLMTAIGGFLDAYTCFVAGALSPSLTGRWLTTRSIWVVAGILVIFSTVQLRLSLSAEIYLDRNH